jgi:hypothetical protein
MSKFEHMAHRRIERRWTQLTRSCKKTNVQQISGGAVTILYQILAQPVIKAIKFHRDQKVA